MFKIHIKLYMEAVKDIGSVRRVIQDLQCDFLAKPGSTAQSTNQKRQMPQNHGGNIIMIICRKKKDFLDLK